MIDVDDERGLAHPPATVDATLDLLGRHDYVADRKLATAVFLALKLSGHIDWSWWLVLLPSIISTTLHLLALIGEANK